jgi:hypothetical protein
MLAAQRNANVDPLLRSLGLIAQFTLDPKRWAVTVMTRYQAGDRFLKPAVSLEGSGVDAVADAPSSGT